MPYCQYILADGTVTRKAPYLTGFADSSSAFDAATARIAPAALGDLSRRGYSEDEIFALVVPKRTLARRKAANELLTVEETDKALRLERIAVQAERVFGDADKAHRWLRKAKRELKGETPLAWLASEAGARVVEEMLFRIEHGIFA
jgi:putative toxin-antitoxin system antitoxin component (TIGR02293 family)